MSMPMDRIVDKAREFAIKAHGDQVRKYTGDPYHAHLGNVALILHLHGLNPLIVAAGWLHDTLEDTATTRLQLQSQFGVKIARIVWEVTDQSKPSDGNRAARKAIDREHLASSSSEGASVKLADLIDNTRDIAANDPHFAKLYLREKALLLPVLQHGKQSLVQRAQEVLESAQAALKAKVA